VWFDALMANAWPLQGKYPGSGDHQARGRMKVCNKREGARRQFVKIDAG